MGPGRCSAPSILRPDLFGNSGRTAVVHTSSLFGYIGTSAGRRRWHGKQQARGRGKVASGRGIGKTWRRGATVGLVTTIVSLMVVTTSSAAPAFLAKSPEDGKGGSAAGRIQLIEGLAADPNLPGHVFVVDRGNARVDEFTAWGSFVKAWGWGVLDGEAELETCTAQSGCQNGTEGSGGGQFKSPEAVAVDGEGNVYVLEAENHRVQKFEPGAEGEAAKFLLAFGSEGTGPGQFGKGKFGYLNRLAASPTTNEVFVGEGERIQVFNSNGSFKEEIEGGDLATRKVQALATDSEGKLYAAFEGEAEVHKLEPKAPGKFIGPQFKPELEAERPKALGTDGSKNLYVALRPTGEEPTRVQEYDKEGKCLTCGTAGEGGKPGFDRSPNTQLEGVAASSACGPDDAYVAHFGPSAPSLSFISAWGQPPNTALCPQPAVPPVIKAQYTLGVETAGAEVGADINPKFWNDTAYHVQYGTGECRSGGCPLETTQTTLTSQVTSTPLPTGGVLLEGLEPGTTYHYRFVAQSSGGGPVFGIDPDGPEGPEEASEEAGLEGTFTTFREPEVEPCPPNEAFRAGPSALLPDCRAYEMVSPIDKEGGDIAVLPGTPTLLPAVLSEAAVDGGKLAYGSYRPFGDAESAPLTSQYLAARHAGVGWESHGISPPRGKVIFSALQQANAEFKAFSPDLCSSWLESFAEPPLAPGAPAGNVDLYRRTDDECGGPGYEALNTAPAPDGLLFELQGLSADGSTAVFKANRALAPGATEGKTQLYGVRGGEERFLCILPGGSPFTGSCQSGWGSVPQFNSQQDQVTNALAVDGRRVYWTASDSGPGKIYLRENPFGEGTECAGSESPCTLEVSKAAEEEAGTTKGSQFWAAATDGSKAVFTTGTSSEGKEPKLYEYRLADESSHLIAGSVLGVMGTSADASRIYFASKEVLGGSNVEGKSAVAGTANLYLYEAGEPGSFRFIGTLTSQDLLQPSPVAEDLQFHEARISPDGITAVFASTAPLTGYDNTDRSSGQADRELFLYDATANGGDGRLLCASCNPSGARPAGQEFKLGARKSGPWTAARIPVPQNVLYASRVLADNGRRLFFDSYDVLSPRDTNGRADVYQWEAPGEGGCTEFSPSFSPTNGGCVDLISSGQSAVDSELLDASPSGNDIFFTTLSSLLPQDFGLQDVYDARVNGGLPSPPPPPPSCEGESCRHPAPPPALITPASGSYEGPEDRGEAKKKGCPKGKHRVNGKCVKKHHHHKKHKPKHGRRAGR
jgi:NHL repeat